VQSVLSIPDRFADPQAPTFIVAEAGSNHDGDLSQAHRLIDVAVEAGVDAVKFQTFEARRLYPRSAGTSDYLRRPTPIYELIERMEMPADWLPELRDHAQDAGIAFISSPFDEAAVELLDPYVAAFKIASYELTHVPLLQAVARHGKPVLLSTGASDLDEVRAALETLREAGCSDPILLQCTAAYPTPPEAANVRALVTLHEELGVRSGLSDHTREPTAAPAAAAALGACVIEKHFTLSNDLPGPDHAFAVEPDELRAMVRAVRGVEAVLGSGAKRVLGEERELRSFARRSLFTTRAVRAGERFAPDNLDVLRCGKLEAGLPPSEYERVLGCVAARDLPGETCVREEDLA
jgi:N-acetylneuraminate synthase